MKVKNLLRLFSFPAAALLWLLGWICYCIGERKDSRESVEQNHKI